MRVFITMLGFNTPEMIRGAVENFEATTTDQENRRCIKTIFDCGFPLGDREANRREIKKIAVEYGWWHTEIQNEGVMANHNKVIHDFYRMEKGDWYSCFDPDVRWQQKGWISASIEALQSDENAVFCAAALPFHGDEWCWKQHGRTISTLPSGLRIARYQQLVAWSTGLWKGEWLAARPRDFKAAHPQYGYVEHRDIELMNQHGKTWMTLVDYLDHHLGADPVYCQWKIACAGFKTDLSFEAWLKEKR